MANPFPNAVYPVAWTEANFVKSGDAPVNEAATGLTVTDVVAGKGPLSELEAVTTNDADKVSSVDGEHTDSV